MHSVITSLREFARETRGSAAVLFAITLFPVLLGVGVAIDYGRALIVRERLQDAMDSAGLAAGSWVGLSPSEMQAKAQQYFDANYPPETIGTVSALNVSIAGNEINLSASAEVPTTFMKLAHYDSIGVAAKSTIAVGTGTLEVALVLDNSGSMSGSKIDSLKTAADTFVDILFTSAQYSVEPDPLKIAVVPFAAGVNVGTQYSNAGWMDTSGIGKYHAYEMKCYANGGTLNSSGICSVNVGSSINNFTLFNSLKDHNGNALGWGGCVEARPVPYDVNDAAPSGADTVFVPMFAPDEPDNWTATTSNCTTVNKCTFSCADGGSSCSSSSSTLVFNGAPPGSFSYNNYLPDAGENEISNTCSTAGSFTTTFAVTVASPAVFTKVNHGFAAGDQVILSTSGSLPSGLNNRTRYYVRSTGLTTNTFQLSATSGGSAVNTSGSQSGTHLIANVFTCRSGSANCARSPSSGTTVGQAETTAFGSKNLPNRANCKYGTPANKATGANVTVGGIPAGPNFMCTSAPLLPLSTSQNVVKSAINAMQAQGATGIMEGAMWGWRVLSPGEPFTEGRAYNTENNLKVLVLMTDGQNTYYPNSKFVKSWYDIYGYVARGQLGTTSTSSSTWTAAMNARTLEACENIKAAGIVVYTVAFQIPSDQASALTLLQSCASDEDKYFEPNSEAGLLSAFNAIGQAISMLRIAK